MSAVQSITLHSKIDPSVNTLIDGYETRFVSRDYTPIIYLSSFDGCDQACRMCHLTQNGTTSMNPADVERFVQQATASLIQAKKHFADKTQPSHLHYNFMARGEPLLNKTIMDNWPQLSAELIRLANEYFLGISVKFKISTIMPPFYEVDDNGTILSGYTEIPFKVNKPEIYYSFYSAQTEFRKRWIPKAQEPKEALRILATYRRGGGEVRIHCAFIEGHNDSLVSVLDLVRSIKYYNTSDKFNIIRFNSPDESKWIEPTEEQLLDIKKFLIDKGFDVQMVERVGMDVGASCGMFINTDK